MRKQLAVASFLLLLLCVFFRENMLLAINAILAEKSIDRSFTYWFADFFRQISKDNLYQLKWVISLTFTIAITGLTVFALHQWFNNKAVLKLLMWLYSVVFVLILLIALIGYFTVGFNEVYPFLRRVFGIIHSPIPFFILFLLFQVNNKS